MRLPAVALDRQYGSVANTVYVYPIHKSRPFVLILPVHGWQSPGSVEM
jgi:hypothetical protein